MTCWYLLGSIDAMFWVAYELPRVLEDLKGVGFQGKNCITKMVSNFSEIDFGIPKHKKKISKNNNMTFW